MMFWKALLMSTTDISFIISKNRNWVFKDFLCCYFTFYILFLIRGKAVGFHFMLPNGW